MNVIGTLGPIIYFMAGVVTTVLAASIQIRQRKQTKQRWSSIQNLRWSWELDFPLEGTAKAIDVARMVAACAVNQVEKDREKTALDPIEIAPGDYTIRMTMNASFVKREGE